jgi:PAS domain S-box-containing protein
VIDDPSDRRALEARLQESDRLWRSLVESSPDVIMIIDVEATILFVNRVGPPWEHRAIVGEKLWTLTVDGDPEPITSAIRYIVETRQPARHLSPGLRASGEQGWFEVRMLPLALDGKVERLLLSAADITERKLDAEKLAASERRFRALVEHGSDCIALIDDAGRFTYVSPAVRTTLGYEPDELIGKLALGIAHPDDHVVAAAKGVLPLPGDAVEAIVRLRHKDGSWRSLEGTATNFLDDPAIRALVANRRDVTDRIRKEERLAFQAHVLAQMSQPVIVTDATTANITFWNHAAERVYGWAEVEVLGKQSDELLQTSWPGPGGREGMVSSLRERSAWDGEIEQTTRAGERIAVEVSIHLVRDERGVPQTGIAVTQDVTERKRLEEQLRQSQKMEAIGLLAGGVAHDFNNILAIIVGFAEVATRNLAAGRPVDEALEEVSSAARRGAELTRKLLTLSRKQIVQPRAVDVVATVSEFTRLIERIVGEDVEIVVERAPEPLVVRVDPIQLEQVLLNLCTNARQAMPEGGKLWVTTCATSFDASYVRREPWAHVGAFAELIVSDTGVGMDSATRARAFEPFFTTKVEGTGLGLATVYGIARQHGGFVHVESAQGAGTRVRVFLPLLDEEVQSAPASRRVEASRGGVETILVAEDEPSLRSIVAASLREAGYTVIVASNGEEAAREFEARPDEIALVVLDVVMPRLGARGAYERMRATSPNVKVLLTTGYAPESTRIGEILDPARVRVLEKPFTQQALVAEVRRLLDSRSESRGATGE